LIVDAQRCPFCGRRRGFIRLFDAININSGKTRKTSKVLETQLKPLYEKQSVIDVGAKRFERDSAVAMEKAYEKATPAERAKMQPLQGQVMPAGAVLGGLSPQARQDTRECITPALLNRKVRPEWHR
jgi:hypothetical protein